MVLIFFRIESAPATPVTTITDPSSPLSPTSPYFTTSEGNATFFTSYSQDVSEEASPTKDETTPVIMDNIDLRQKKVLQFSNPLYHSTHLFKLVPIFSLLNSARETLVFLY